MPRLRRYLPPLLLLLPVIFICGKLMFSEGTDASDEIQSLIPAELQGQLPNPSTETRGWPWAFRRTFSDFNLATTTSTEVATRYNIVGLLGDALVWTLPILIAAWLLVRHHRRTGSWLRFSLRALLVFVCVVGMTLGLGLKEYRQWQREQRVIQKYDLYCPDSSECPEWLRRLWFSSAGPEFLHHPTRLELTSSRGYVTAGTQAERTAIAREALADLPDISNFQTDGVSLLELRDSASFSKLTSLELWIKKDVTRVPEMLELVGTLTQLKSLTIYGYELSDKDLPFLGKLTNLEYLQVDFAVPIDDSGIAQLANLKRLGRLVVEGGNITDRSLDTIAELSSLEVLVFRNQPRVTNMGLSKLASLTNLKSIGLFGTGATPGVTKFLEASKHLEEIDLANSKIDDSEFEQLAKFSKLHSLTLFGTHIKGAGLDQLASLKFLGWVDFSNTEIGDEALQTLSRCESIRHLWLAGCQQITDEGVAHLAQLPRLTVLGLENTQITDQAIDSILTFPSLEILHLHECAALTDEGLRKLARAPKLSSLSIRSIPNVSDETITILKQNIANVYQ